MIGLTGGQTQDGAPFDAAQLEADRMEEITVFEMRLGEMSVGRSTALHSIDDITRIRHKSGMGSGRNGHRHGAAWTAVCGPCRWRIPHGCSQSGA